MPRSPHTIPLLVLTLLVGGITVAAVLVVEWLPERGSEQADSVNGLLWFVIWAAVVIFTIVTTVLLYSVWRFRARPGDEGDGPPIHGNTKLEITWTVVPTLLLAVVATWAYLVLSDNEALAQDRLVVDVTAEQFAWTFTYPEGNVASGDLRIPAGRQIELKMRSKDVIHDFYVPEFWVKQDVVPGITTRIVFTPDQTGAFQAICAELCGVGHGLMRARVLVMEPSEYDAWLAGARRQVASQAAPASPVDAGQEPPGAGGTSGGVRTPGTRGPAVDAGEAPAQQPAEPVQPGQPAQP